MDFFEYWKPCLAIGLTKHPDDLVVLDELNHELQKPIDSEFEFGLPPGPFFGPLKTAKIVLCYANPSRDSKTSEVVADVALKEQLFAQLDGLHSYPYQIPGWDKWFKPVANSLFNGNCEQAAKHISVFNLVPYASTNMDIVQSFATSLPSVWAAQEYLRYTLIPKAKRKEILLVMCRSSQLWGLQTSHDAENIIINRTRVGFTDDTKMRVKAWCHQLALEQC
ncbi:hypothetical protein JYB87_01485 [Shewanella avicenniae]|uniref:Uncharacterized protein n=1 Tax=Shewanella avicenniae TaxID=2814294 RepID=A0ABX7QSH7_9GAMM|nr:hypothetical protein [Shewanella avicenniae]QSX33955.1 hypothetical protein JYB87_01485 [Shewanella avicenniae]